MITWTPYALVSMYRAFTVSSRLSRLAASLPSLIAKSSLIWTSLLYLFTNRPIKTRIKQLFFLKEITQENEYEKAISKSSKRLSFYWLYKQKNLKDITMAFFHKIYVRNSIFYVYTLKCGKL